MHEGERKWPRTLRSQHKRNMLFRSQGGLCARCGNPMDPDDWEADHIEPWRRTHRTNVHEMQALHPRCNRRKGATFMEMEWDRLRPGQRRAVKMIEDRVRAGERYTAIVLPTRYGKSDVMRIAAMWLRAQGVAAAALVLSPGRLLMLQMVDGEKWRATVQRYDVRFGAAIRYSAMDRVTTRPNANGEVLLSATIQLAEQSGDDVVEWIESEVRSTGRPVVVFVDEGHTGSERNEWGKAVGKFADAGAHVVLLTATPERDDGHRIPGFAWEEVDQQDVIITKVRPSDAVAGYNHVQVYGAQKTVLKLVPDVYVPFSDAWHENALCKVARIAFDVEIKTEAGEQQAWLSDLPESAARAVLGRLVRHAEVIDEGCRLLAERQKLRRDVQPDVAGIVYVANDNDEADRGTDRQAKHVQRRLKAHGLTYAILTMNASGDPTSVMEEFRKGGYDGIIVKQMAGMGLDVERLKIGLDLSPTRTYSGQVQRMMRPATPYGRHMTCDWITPDDVVSAAIFQKVVRDEGGEASMTDMQLIREYIMKPKDGPEPGPKLTPGDDTRLRDPEDSDGNRGEAANWDRAMEYTRMFPELTERLSWAEILTRVADRPTNATAEAGEVIDTGDEREDRRARANERVREILNVRGVPYIPGDKGAIARWRKELSGIWFSAKDSARWPDPRLPLDECNDLAMLDALVAVLERL